MSSTRDRIEAAVRALLEEISKAIDDNDVTESARMDIARLWSKIDCSLDMFNLPTGPDPLSDGGPTREDLEGTVTHDIG